MCKDERSEARYFADFATVDIYYYTLLIRYTILHILATIIYNLYDRVYSRIVLVGVVVIIVV